MDRSPQTEVDELKTSNVIRIVATIVILSAIMLIQPGCAKKMSIIYFTDSTNNFLGEAMDNMGYSYVTTYSFTDFADAFVNDAWDLVVFDNRHMGVIPYLTEPLFQALLYYIWEGGKVLISTPYLEYDSLEIAWAALGYKYVSKSAVPINVYRLNAASEFWNEPEEAPDLNFTGATDLFGSEQMNAFKGSAYDSGVKMATFNQSIPGDLNSGAVFVANGGRTILNAFFLDDAVRAGIPIDSDSDEIADAVEWYMDELFALEQVPGEKVQPGPPQP